MDTMQLISTPGETLQKVLEHIGMSQRELAIRTGVSDKHVSTIINGTKGISASYARKLEYALGSEKDYWAKIQAEYDLTMVRLQEENHITAKELAVLRHLQEVIRYCLRSHIMHNDCGDTEKVLQLRSLLRVSDLTAIPHISYNAAYRAQLNSNTKVDPYVLFAWQRLCEIKLEHSMPSFSFSPVQLQEKIPMIKSMISQSDINEALHNLKCIFASCGIAFDVVQHFRGAPVQGFIKKTDSNQVILCLTIRGKAADRFWFSLFHEIGHILHGDLDMRFVDFDSVKTVAEEAADRYARDTLISPVLYKSLIDSGEYSFYPAIERLARACGVPAWIVVGRLHSDEWLDWNVFAKEIPAYSWVDES